MYGKAYGKSLKSWKIFVFIASMISTEDVVVMRKIFTLKQTDKNTFPLSVIFTPFQILV